MRKTFTLIILRGVGRPGGLLGPGDHPGYHRSFRRRRQMERRGTDVGTREPCRGRHRFHPHPAHCNCGGCLHALPPLTVPEQYGHFMITIKGNNGRLFWAEINTRHGDPQGSSFAQQTGRGCAYSYRTQLRGRLSLIRIARGCLKKPKSSGAGSQRKDTHFTHRRDHGIPRSPDQ